MNQHHEPKNYEFRPRDKRVRCRTLILTSLLKLKIPVGSKLERFCRGVSHGLYSPLLYPCSPQTYRRAHNNVTQPLSWGNNAFHSLLYYLSKHDQLVQGGLRVNIKYLAPFLFTRVRPTFTVHHTLLKNKYQL